MKNLKRKIELWILKVTIYASTTPKNKKIQRLRFLNSIKTTVIKYCIKYVKKYNKMPPIDEVREKFSDPEYLKAVGLLDIKFIDIDQIIRVYLGRSKY